VTAISVIVGVTGGNTMETEYGLKKLANGQYEFTMKMPELLRTEVVSEESVRKHYKELRDRKNQSTEQLKLLNKKIKESELETDEELEKFIELANKAAKYNEFRQAKNQQKAVLDTLKRIEDEIARIEKVSPEFKRLKAD